MHDWLPPTVPHYPTRWCGQVPATTLVGVPLHPPTRLLYLGACLVMLGRRLMGKAGPPPVGGHLNLRPAISTSHHKCSGTVNHLASKMIL